MTMFPSFEVMDKDNRRVMVNASKICSVIETEESTLIVLESTTIRADENYHSVIRLIHLVMQEVRCFYSLEYRKKTRDGYREFDDDEGLS